MIRKQLIGLHTSDDLLMIPGKKWIFQTGKPMILIWSGVKIGTTCQ